MRFHGKLHRSCESHWQQFVCDLETYYSIDRRFQTCQGIEIPPVKTEECYTDDNRDRFSIWGIILIVLGGLAVLFGLSIALFLLYTSLRNQSFLET